MTKAMRKDLFREIRNSRSRFISILVMAALSALFLTGLRSTGPDMKDAADTYFDDQMFMDIWVTSTLGLTDSDVEALLAVDGITAAAGDWSLDAIAADSENEYTVKLHSIIPEGINAPTVIEGTLPEAAGECAVEAALAEDMNLQVGDTLQLSDTDTIEDALTTRTLTVTAIVDSPLYISISEHGTSSLGNGTVEGFVLLSRDTVTLDYYTEIYLIVDGAAELDTYGDAYADLISEIEDAVTPVAEELTVQRYEDIVSDAQTEIDEATEDYEQEKQDAIDELNDAQAELDEAREEGEQEIADAEAELADARAELDQGWLDLEEGRQTYEQEIADAEAELADARAELDQGWLDLEDGRQTYEQEIADAQATLNSALAELQSGQAELAESLATLQSGEEEYAQQEAEAQAQLEEARAALEAADAQIAEQAAQLETAQEQLDALTAQAEALTAMGDTENAALLQAQIETLTQTVTAGNEALAAAQAETEVGWTAYETQAAAAEAALAEARATLDAGWTAYYAGEQELADGQAEYNAGVAELAQARTEGQQELDDAEAELNEGETEYADGLAELEQAKIDGQQELDDAEAELNDGEAEYADGLAELEDARITLEEELADAQQEIDDAWAEAEESFAEAEEEIADAQAELDEVETGTVYVLDRDSNAGYVTREQDSDRITSLGNVFPLLFYVVAVLVCLTTMTRMVEEKRTQIGALKSLGYGTGAVAAEYLLYGAVAALIGSVLGVLIGAKMIPYIICTAYGVMYRLPDAALPYRPGICGITIAATLLCIIAATLWAVLSTMRETPASLLRPRSPKAGKRIFLEKIPFIWKHLNFSAKVAARNLLRYKKRFWMTIIGVGGCTALVITGLSLHPGLFAITEIQYDELSLYNLQVIVETDEAGENLAEALQMLEEDDRVEETMISMTSTVSWISDSRTVDGYLVSVESQEDMEGLMVLRDPDTEEPITIPEDGVVMSLKISELLDVSAGDTITVEMDDQRYEVRIAAICDQYVRHYIYMLDSYYESVFGEAPDDNAVYAVVTEDTEEAISEVATDMLRLDSVSSVTNVLAWANSFEEQLSVVNIVVVVIVLAAAALAFVVLYNLTNISITERLRELATIKVLGFFDGEVAMYVYRENIVLTLLGILLGQPLGSLLYTYIIRTVEMDIVMFGRYSALQAHLGSVALTILFALLVNFVMYFRLKKIDMVESLKSVE